MIAVYTVRDGMYLGWRTGGIDLCPQLIFHGQHFIRLKLNTDSLSVGNKSPTECPSEISRGQNLSVGNLYRLKMTGGKMRLKSANATGGTFVT
jgi:hypothetical protein